MDYAGPKFEVVDRKTGEVHDAMVFVGVLAANHNFVDVTRSRALLPTSPGSALTPLRCCERPPGP